MSATVKVEIFARIDDTDVFELGVVECTREAHEQQVANLLRAAADELERRPQP